MSELRCPTCHKLFDSDETVAMPFCSVRCKQIDLAGWLNEEYGIPVEPEDREGRSEQPASSEEEE